MIQSFGFCIFNDCLNFRKIVKKDLAGKKFHRTISHNVLQVNQVRSKTATGILEKNSPSRIKAHMMESLVPRSKSDERTGKLIEI